MGVAASHVHFDVLRPNAPPTAAETVRLDQYIKSREKDITNITLSLMEEEAQINAYSKAIENLEAAIPRGKKALQAYEDNLVALRGIQARLNEVSSEEALELKPEDHSAGLVAEMKNSIDGPVTRSAISIEEQVEILQKDIRSLWDKVRALELA